MRLNHTPQAPSLIGVEIGQRRHVPADVPLLARGRAGVTADAEIEVDDETELFLTRNRARQVGHASATPAATLLLRIAALGAGEPAAIAHDLRRLRQRGGRLQRREARRAVPGLGGGRPLDADAQIVPGGLPGDRVGVGETVGGAVPRRRQQVGNQVVQQKSSREFGRIRREVPGAAALADRVPGPHRVRVDPVHQLDLRLDPAGMARHIDPVVVVEAERAGRGAVDEQPVLAEDLAQPGILRVPGMVHLHRPLRDRVQRKAGGVDARFLERRIPERQRVEIGLDPGAVLFRRHARFRVPAPRGGSAATSRHRAAARSARARRSAPSRSRFRDRPCWRACRRAAPAAIRISRSSHSRCSGRAASGSARPCPAPRRPRRASRRAARCRGCARAARCNPCSRRDSAARRSALTKAGKPSFAPSSISTSWNGRTSRSGFRIGWRIESPGPSGPPIGRSSNEMQSQRSK